jgi:prolycopene isomerase
MCRVTCLNVANPNASPKGTCILNFTTLFTDNCWGNVEPESYFTEKDNFMKRIIALYEDATGIKITDYIEELEIATPLTFARYLNTPQGTIYGYSCDNTDNMLSRFMTEESDSDTKGLRFCGGWGTQLASFSSAIASGRNTCYATLNDINENYKGETK